jgi:hypothetical protein
MSSSRKRSRHHEEKKEDADDNSFQDAWLEALKAEANSSGSPYFGAEATTPKERKTELLFRSSASASPDGDPNAASGLRSRSANGELSIHWVGEETSPETLRISRSRSIRRGTVTDGWQATPTSAGGDTPTSKGVRNPTGSASVPQTPYALLEDWQPATNAPNPSASLSPTIVWFQFEPLYLPPLSTSLLQKSDGDGLRARGTTPEAPPAKTHATSDSHILGKSAVAAVTPKQLRKEVKPPQQSSPSKLVKKRVDFQPPQEVIEVFSQTQRPAPVAAHAPGGAKKIEAPPETKGESKEAAAVSKHPQRKAQKVRKEQTPSTSSESESGDSDSESDTSGSSTSNSSVQVERVTRATRPARTPVADKPITRSEAARLRALGFRSPFKELHPSLHSKQQQQEQKQPSAPAVASTSIQKPARSEMRPAEKKPVKDLKEPSRPPTRTGKGAGTSVTAKEETVKEGSGEELEAQSANPVEDLATMEAPAENPIASMQHRANPFRRPPAPHRPVPIPPPPRMVSITVNLADPLQLAVTGQHDCILPYESTFAELEAQLLGQLGYRWKSLEFYTLARRIGPGQLNSKLIRPPEGEGLESAAHQDMQDPELARWIAPPSSRITAQSHVNEFLPLVERVWSAEDRLSRLPAGTRATVLSAFGAREDDPRRLARVVYAQPSVQLTQPSGASSRLPQAKMNDFDPSRLTDNTRTHVAPAATPAHIPAPLPPPGLRPTPFTLDDTALPSEGGAHDSTGMGATGLDQATAVPPTTTPSSQRVVLYILLMTDTGVPTSTGPPLLFTIPPDRSHHEALIGPEESMDHLAGAARNTLCEVLALPLRMQRYILDLPIVPCSVERVEFSGEHFLYLGQRTLASRTQREPEVGIPDALIGSSGRGDCAADVAKGKGVEGVTECVSFALILRRLDIGVEVALMNSALNDEVSGKGSPVVGTVDREHWQQGRVSIDLLIGGSTLCTGVHPLDLLPLHL